MRRHTLLPLLACLSLVACRELGSYLPPEELRACEENGGPDCPDAGVAGDALTVELHAPHLEVGAEPVPRHATISFTVGTTRPMARVDLTCAGLQLASWQLAGLTGDTLSATVDLLPCRPAALQVEGVSAPVEVLPLQLVVTSTLGTRAWGDVWRVPAILLEEEPGTFPLLTLSGGRVRAHRPFVLTITSDRPLTERPAVTLEAEDRGVFDVRPQGDDGLTWSASFSPGLAPAGWRSEAGTDLAALEAPRAVEVKVVGRAVEGRTTQLRAEIQVDRVVESHPLTLAGRDWSPGVRGDALAPVALDGGLVVAVEVATQDGTTVQPLWLPFDNGSGDGGTSLPVAPGGPERKTRALLSTGQALVEDPLGSQFLQLAPGSEEVSGLSTRILGLDRAVRLGDGRLCTEIMVGTAECGIPMSGWTFTCLDPQGRITTAGPAYDPDSWRPLGPARAFLGVGPRMVNYGYLGEPCPVGTGGPEVAPMQLQTVDASGAPREAVDLGFDGLVAINGGLLPQLVLLDAGGASPAVVVGYVDSVNRRLAARYVLLGDLEIASSWFFASGDSAAFWAHNISTFMLFATPEPGVVSLLFGTLELWTPGSSVPAATLNFPELQLLAPPQEPPYESQRVVGGPVVHHVFGQNGLSVTVALWDLQEGRVVVLELDPMLRPIWAWRSAPGLVDRNTPFSLSGVRDGPFVDLVIWGRDGGLEDRVIRLAR